MTEVNRAFNRENVPEHSCGSELIELPEDEPTYVRFAQCARCGAEFTFAPDSDWVTAVYSRMRMTATWPA
jgi:hypothetical protein